MTLKKAKSSNLVIIGSGLAGYTLVREIRRHDQNLPITVITGDSGQYYSKPQLSNALTHKKTPDQLALFTPEKFAQQFNITIKNNYLINNIKTDNYLNSLNYSDLVLATGANPVILPGLKQAITVNNLADYHHFREQLNSHKKIIIIGAGLVGCEFANDLINTGHEVTVIAPEQYPLASLIPELAGKGLKTALEKKGIQWQLGRCFQPSDQEDALKNQKIILSAVGLRPNLTLAQQLNLNTKQGIVVNSYLESSHPHIYALGDCAEIYGRVLPYIQPLTLCARALAQTLLGEPTEVIYPPMPVHIKTPAYPIVVISPSNSPENQWKIEDFEEGIAGMCYNRDQLVGLCLTGSQTSRINDFLAKISHI